ncbi:MAG TPA: MarR family transcriptional regulator [Acidimicrobiales bacterium]|nr:MarR family transcriptional regulator [Acidimicrobiales bacterium]
MTASRDALGVLPDDRLGFEARAAESDHLDVRLWLRLLACTNQIEQEIRTRMRLQFGTTLARFDYLAQLERHPQGLRMSALSRYLMVSGGNVTGLTDQLVADGCVERVPDPDDKRATLLRLTGRGRSRFEEMAAAHEGWLTDMFGGFGRDQERSLFDLLGRFRMQIAHTESGREAGPPAGPAGPVRSVSAARRARRGARS